MISVYDKIIDNLKGYRLPHENHDFDYNHPLTGVEDERIFNREGMLIDIDNLEDIELKELEVLYEKLSLASKVSYMHHYDEDNQKDLFTYYKGSEGIYKGKNITRISSMYLKELRNQVQHVIYKKKMAIQNQNANELLPTLEKFLEIHKQGNPNIYPDWLRFTFKEVRWGDLYVQPIINIEKLLESGDAIRQAKVTRDFIRNIWNRLVSAQAYSRHASSPSPRVRTTNVLFEGFEYYMKNVVNKKIKQQIKNLPRGRECVHSIIFRYRSNIDDIEIQIHPRYKRECTYGWNSINTYDFESKIADILYEYGWIKNRNYVTSTNKD
tara:strand:+ start:1579 stop:2550 length:972 start_codon:yes stop_codon:yes gene_type:complete